MSCPSNDSDVVYVYGIVTHIYTEEVTAGCIDRSLTIANSLWDVVQELRTNPNYCSTEFQNNNNNGDIDFV